MPEERKSYSRYAFNRGLTTLWKGDPAIAGALFRSIVLTSADPGSTDAVFQLLALEGAGGGTENGEFAGSQAEVRILFDQDLHSSEAKKHFNELVFDAEAEGFEKITFWDEIEFQSKLRVL